MKLPNPVYSVFLILTVLILLMAKGASISGDEPTQATIGNNILKFYQTFGKDDTALKPVGIDQFQYYGSSFDTFCQFVIQVFNIQDAYTFRHLMNGLLGGFILLFLGLFGRLLKNDWVGVAAMVLAFCSPRLLGHSFNNPKDIPFALGYLMSLYFMAKWLMNLDQSDRRILIYLTLSIAFTNSIRIGGMILYGYLGLFLFLTMYSKVGLFKIYKYKKQVGLAILVVGVSYFLGLLLWPFGLVSPLKNPMEALAGFEKVALGINQIFEGSYTESNLLPSYYLSKYILITTPVIVLIGFMMFLGQQLMIPAWRKNLIHYLLLLSIVFPLAYIVYKESNVYGGWRQVLFVYPPLVLVSALGLYHMFMMAVDKLPKFRWLFWPLLVLMLVHPIRHIVANQPYVYIYFNEALGGVKKAYGNYETDYYYHSTKEATLWLKDYILANHPQETDTILTKSNHRDYSYYLQDEPRIKSAYARYYDRHMIEWDYYLCVNTHIHPYQLRHQYWPPAGTIHTIDVDGMPICAIIKRPSKDDLIGSGLLKQQQFQAAIPYYENYLLVDSTNCSVWASLANCYIGLNNNQLTMQYALKSLQYYDTYSVALDMLGRSQLGMGNIELANTTFQKLAKERPNYHVAYFYQAICLYEMKDYYNALKKADTCIYYGGDFKPIFQVVGQIKEAQGLKEEARFYYGKAN